ncbi:ABC transporter ATP-binding protein [Hyphomonas sp.]|uniref:ABC transporter ATP-binding protein n=1 Tax=Hyphomonas sp. TaxID=87 RepID=UPI00391AB75A
MIAARNLSVSLSGRRVVEDVSFALAAGEFAALTGPNGAGKSTVLTGLAGVVPVSGEVLIGGQQADGMSRAERARQLAWLPQTRPVAWNLLAEDVAALGRFTVSPAPYGRMGAADRQAVDAALARADAAHLAGKAFQTLSGGEQARIHLARLLASPAPCLLLDEPCAALDISHQLLLMQTLAEEARGGRAVLVVVHDLSLALRFCGRALVMQGGRLVADGEPGEALSAPNLRAIFGVEPESGLTFRPADR